MKPRLRFNFTNDYSYELIKDSFCIKNNNSFSREELCTWGTIKNIHYGDIHTKLNKITNIRNENLPYITSENEKKITELCEDYDVLIADASEDYSDIGKAIQLINVDKCVAGLHTILARPKVKSFYYVYLLSSWFVRKQFMRYACGAKVLGLSKASLQKVLLPTPNLTEQNKIATFLNLYYKKIDLQKKKIESLKSILNFAIYSEFNMIKQQISLGSIAVLYQPQTITQNDFVDGGKYKVFGANGYIGMYNNYNHEQEQVVISCRGEKCSQVNIVEPYSWITGNSMVINLDSSNDINKRFVYYALKSQNLKYLITGSGQPQIVRSDIINHKIPICEYSHQLKIVNTLENINKKINLEKYKLGLLEKYKQGLLQQMLI